MKKRDIHYIFLCINRFYYQIKMSFYKSILKNKFLKKYTSPSLRQFLLNGQRHYNVRRDRADCLLMDYSKNIAPTKKGE